MKKSKPVEVHLGMEHARLINRAVLKAAIRGDDKAQVVIHMLGGRPPEEKRRILEEIWPTLVEILGDDIPEDPAVEVDAGA